MSTRLGSLTGWFSALALGAVLAWCVPSSPARADDADGSRTPSIERDGRGLVFGVAGAFLLGMTPLTNIDSPDQPALSPGFSAQGRFGVELPPGIALAIVGGGGMMGSTTGPVPLFLRAAAELRYTLDLSVVRPFASVALGFLMLKAGLNLRATFTSEASLGVEIPLAPWACLEVSVGAEVIAPGDAVREVMVFALLPRVGAGFSY